ncbi:hypothetical protein K439DRAFT_1622356 [Ramaria rubella]|nr:hypothetical protein K439DRAFT_1622356 [Ramaria rubella]
MWVKEMEGIDDTLSDAMEACLSIQPKFTIPSEVMKIQSDIEAAKSWVSVMKAGFTVASPNPLVMAAVGLASPQIDTPPPKAIPSVPITNQLAHDNIAIVPRHEAKFLSGVGIADTHRIAMPAEYGDGSAYHIAGVVYVDGVVVENKKKCEMCDCRGYWCYGLPGCACGQCCRDGKQCSLNPKHTKWQTAEALVLTAAAKGKGKAVVKPSQSIVPLESASSAIAGPSLLPPIPSTCLQPSCDAKCPLDLIPNSSPGESPVCPSK